MSGVMIWAWRDAPDELRALSACGGDEYFVALVTPPALDEPECGEWLRSCNWLPYPLDTVGHGDCIDVHMRDDGTAVVIVAN